MATFVPTERGWDPERITVILGPWTQMALAAAVSPKIRAVAQWLHFKRFRPQFPVVSRAGATPGRGVGKQR